MTVWFESAANSSSTKRTVRKFETAAVLTSSGQMNEREEETEKENILFPSLPPPFSSLLPDKNNIATKGLKTPYAKLTKG